MWVWGCSFLIYCDKVDPGSFLESKDNHQTKYKRGIFKEKGVLYFGVVLEKKTTFS